MKLSNVLYTLFIIVLIIIMVFIYNKYYFNDYLKSVKEPDKSFFYRDGEIKHNNNRSYCIESTEYNTAIFSKKIDVKKNTPYKITCYVKTEEVQNSLEKKAGGANICIVDTVEKSDSIIGTNDWTKLEFMFNSKNRENVEIGFRLGSYDTDTKGKVYFSDINLVEGEIEKDSEWKMGVFIFKNLDIYIDGEEYKTEMNSDDLKLIEDDLKRFKTSISEISNNKMRITYDTYTIANTLNSISYDEENGYYFDYIDVYDKINENILYGKYDHIFIVFKSEDINKVNQKALEHDWVGLRRNGLFRNRIFKYKTSRK
ncbi:MAG: hypothetical protein HFJ46_00165 [Clostridia bacterium]|nr:hypothetical protein [Clostridia bacterium]